MCFCIFVVFYAVSCVCVCCECECLAFSFSSRFWIGTHIDSNSNGSPTVCAHKEKVDHKYTFLVSIHTK